jgi:hypothetical protein
MVLSFCSFITFQVGYAALLSAALGKQKIAIDFIGNLPSMYKNQHVSKIPE